MPQSGLHLCSLLLGRNAAIRGRYGGDVGGLEVLVAPSLLAFPTLGVEFNPWLLCPAELEALPLLCIHSCSFDVLPKVPLSPFVDLLSVGRSVACCVGSVLACTYR